MAEEKKFFDVRVSLNDADFRDAFQIYLHAERGSDRKYGVLTCAAIAVAAVVLAVVMKNSSFVIYAIGAVLIAVGYYFMPVDRKFLANNKLQLGTEREYSFYAHSVTSREIFEDSKAYDDTEDGETEVSTLSLKAYENERCFLLAEGKIVNQFFYIPKRQLTETQLRNVQKFCKERCSGGYQALEMRSMLTDEGDDCIAMTEAVCNQYYGGRKLHVYDEEGNRVRFKKQPGDCETCADDEYDEDEYEDFTEADESTEAEAPAPAEAADPAALDVDAELEKLWEEDGDDA